MTGERPNFTGTWALALTRSALQIAAPRATTFRIVHQEPQFDLSRTHVYGETSDTWSSALTTDGTEHCQKNGGRTLTAVERLRSAAQSYDNTWVFERQ